MAVAILFLLFDTCEEKKGDDSRLLGTHPASLDRLEKIFLTSENICEANTWPRILDIVRHVFSLFETLKGIKLESGVGTILVPTSR